ncbi:MAG: NAD-dependent epimerase/dehydratase family protein [Pseudomonadota bacterium]
MFDKVLITGGNGNLGRLVAELFEACGTRVVSVDLPGTEGPHSAARDAVIAADIRDTPKIEAVIREHEPQAILHLASLLSGSSEANPERAWQVNATASIDLMRVAAAQTDGPFVFASTIATYGPGLPDPLPPDAPQWPENIYGATKVAVERMGVYLKRKHGFDFRCLRFPMVLSPFAPPGAVTAYPSHAFRAAIESGRFTFPVSPDTGMSNLFLDDVVDSLLAITVAERARLTEPAYNLHGYYVSAREIAETLETRVQGFEARFEPDPVVDDLVRLWPDRIDSAAAKTDWDWTPRFDFSTSAEALLDRIGRDSR